LFQHTAQTFLLRRQTCAQRRNATGRIECRQRLRVPMHNGHDRLMLQTVPGKQLDHFRHDERHVAGHHERPRCGDISQTGDQPGERAAIGLFVADLRQVDSGARLAHADDHLRE